MKSTIIVMTFAAMLTLSACKNAADSTTDADVKEAAPEAKASEGQTYVIASTSTIEFIGSKVTGSHAGGFKDFVGEFTVKDGQLEAGETVIQMASTYSDSEKLTAHLKAPDFFDVENFAETTFVVTSFVNKADAGSTLSGNLTLHGVTKNITFPVKVSVVDGTFSLQAEFDINRKDFGIAYPGRKDDLIRDEVVIKLNLNAAAKA